jgi:hypothetical protein
MPEEVTPKKHSRKGMVLIPVAIAAVVLVGTLIYQGLDLNGARARKTADDIRGLNNEIEASTRSINPHCCGWKPHWEDSGTSTNAIDGTRTEFLTTESVDPEGVDSGSMRYAELRICFENGKLCGGKSIGVGVEVHEMVAPLDDDSEYSTATRLKFDDEKLLREIWGISDDHDMLFPHGRETTFVTQLTQHNKLVLEFSYYEKAPRSVTFDLSGLADKMKSENLVVQQATKAGGKAR